MWAIEQGHSKVVRLLLDSGADVEATDSVSQAIVVSQSLTASSASFVRALDPCDVVGCFG